MNTELPEHLGEKCFAVLLYGPPGTGKTSLFEALANSCEVPFVKVSPGDIAVGGEAAIEKRARAIFTALSLLTKVVIAFDEFEPVIRTRKNSDQKITGGGFLGNFLTPAMLPKLTNLHDRASRQRLAYCLITNHKDQLDAAAIRPGRVDQSLEILNPDPLSRVGAILREVGKRLCEDQSRASCATAVKTVREVQITNTLVDSIEELVRVTSGLPAGLFAKLVLTPKVIGVLLSGAKISLDVPSSLFEKRENALVQHNSAGVESDSLQKASKATESTPLQDFLESWEQALVGGTETLRDSIFNRLH